MKTFKRKYQNSMVIEKDFITPSLSRWPPWVGDKCVAVKRTVTNVQVRDSKNPDGGTLMFTHDEWRVFLEGVRNAEFNL